MKKAPIGYSDFKEILSNPDFLYVDKTGLIEEFLEDQIKILLITRPRRFGKTLNLSTLRYFFDKDYASENRQLFEGLKVSYNQQAMAEQGTRPVIYLTFKDCKERSFLEQIIKIKQVLSQTALEAPHLKSSSLSPVELDTISKIQNMLLEPAELVAFSNSLGGKIYVGVNDDGSVCGLKPEDIRGINQLLSNAASQHVKPTINPLTLLCTIEGRQILVIEVAQGINKPYQDKNGTVWVKSGADKRRATSREELQRLFQRSGLIHADDGLVSGATIRDIDFFVFGEFFQREFDESFDEQEGSRDQTLENMNLLKDGTPNLAGLLLFGKNNQFRLPAFVVKCVCYPGKNIDEEQYMESEDQFGPIAWVFQKTVAFLNRNIRSLQGDQGVNSIGIKEIPKIVFEELVVNALIHRDYFVSAPIRVFVFEDRIEIISPGHLPNNLNIANIKAGNSNIRNPILASYATKLLPYRGLGNGIRRAIKAYPQIDFTDDAEGNLFWCIIRRQ